MKVTCIRHLHFGGLGSFETVLLNAGFDIKFWTVGVDDLATLDPVSPDLLIVLGGPMSVYQTDAFPFINDELRIIDRRLSVAKPLFGSCAGAQLIASALGARVYPGEKPELGWAPLSLSTTGQTSPVRHLAAELTHVLHWHGDVFDLPTGATCLASTQACENQAFALGDQVLGLQFHAEASDAIVDQWLMGHAHQIESSVALSYGDLRTDFARYGATLARQGPLCFMDWLNNALTEGVGNG